MQVKCPVGREVYPSNNYSDCHHNGFSVEQERDSLFVDDGWGWRSPTGEKYWFVAYANQWTWNKHIGPGLTSLAEAYLLTGNDRYAEKAAEMLYLIAKVYSSMDYENQSRYGLMMKQQNIRYPGKVLNRIWETRFITGLAEAYDMIWDRIDHSIALQKMIGKSGREIRSFIEANLLEDAIDAIKQEKILGNFGMHQDALVTLHLARQYAGRDEAIEALINRHSSRFATSGLRYALYNQVKRDGIPYESPGYNTIWVTQMTRIADKLSKMEIDLFGEKRLKRLIDAPLDMVAIGLYTPDTGDGGSVLGGLIGRNADIYHIAYNSYREDKYLHWINRSEEHHYTSFESLFREPLISIPKLSGNRVVEPMPSRLFAGYGLGILNNKADQTALSLTYGMHYSHFHWDFLNFEIFANGQKMMPDLGYPDAMNAFVPGIYSWSTNTISHNTVVVDAKRQQRNLPGTLHAFADGSFARAIDATSPAYVNAESYRRNIIMVDTDNEQSYFVDFFRVSGGTRHDYSLHGPPGEVFQLDGQWSDTLKGTFAGPTVPVGRMYDNERLQKEGPQTGYGGYVGSGFQHLFNLQQLEKGNGMLEYRHIRDKDARLRILLLLDGPQDVFMADAYDKPRGKDHLLKYLIATRESDDETPLKSTFVSLLAPYKGDSCLYQTARLIHPDQGSGHVVVVERDSLTDVVFFDAEASKKVLNRYTIETDAVRAVATFKEDKLTRLFFSEGTYFHTKEQQFKAEEIRGRVVSVDAKNSSLMVKVEGIKMNDGEKLSHRIAHFTNPYRTTVHPLEMVQSSDGIMKITVKDDLVTARLNITDIMGDQLKTTTSMTFAADYIGATLMNDNFQPIGTLRNLQGGVMTFTDNSGIHTVSKGDVTWICNIGAGDEMVIKALFSWSED
ncbi:MAG: heparinase II/III family protein [Proteiniphilum sp.]|nr:heparinase II/III family protein [Proteiniphilum sp.]